jgi:hypothetical protein
MSGAIDWVATVGCEGGPVMVVDLPGFAQWTGAMPFAELSKLDETKKQRFANRRNVLHFWGTLGGAGEQHVECADEKEARAKLADLRAKVKANCPDVVITEDDEQTHFLDPKTNGELLAELEPKSEYDASWQANMDEDAWLHSFGKDARALFWDIQGGGVADVGVSKDGNELLLMRSWLSGEDDTEAEEEAAARALATTRSDSEAATGEVTIASGRAVVIWSPIAPFQLEGIEGPEALSALGESGDPPRLATDMIAGLGTVVRVKPGRYAVTMASTDDEDDEEDERPWSARWCRLTWVGPA